MYFSTCGASRLCVDAPEDRNKRENLAMNPVKIIGIVLIAAGFLALGYGSFTYTKETHDVKIGPIEMSIKDKETVNIPIWAGVGAIVVGGLLLIFGNKR